MGYQSAVSRAYVELSILSKEKIIPVKFLGEGYTADLDRKRLVSLSSHHAVGDFSAILILHYLTSSLKGLPILSNEWLDFKEISGIEGYATTFRARTIEPILNKYGKNPEGILRVLDKLPAKKADKGDVGIIVEAFEKVPILVTLWKGDDELKPEGNILFDKSIKEIFCIEDIIVLAQIVAAAL